MAPNLSQALHLINGETTSQRIAAGNVVPKLLAEKKTPQQIFEQLYVASFSRKPNAREAAALEETLKKEKDAKAVLEDVFWALLNSKEFMFNH